MEEKTRDRYISSIQQGNIVAFKHENQMFSGKVIEVKDDSVVVRTKNASVYYIQKDDITWVKNGSKWPSGIYNALKFSH